ncbi:24689_t:CDS:1, partial [Entrophospora sp. SA101]
MNFNNNRNNQIVANMVRLGRNHAQNLPRQHINVNNIVPNVNVYERTENYNLNIGWFFKGINEVSGASQVDYPEKNMDAYYNSGEQ